MHIVVFGSGGVGGYFGGRLAQAGENVTFIARGAHLEAIRHSGLRLESIKGDFHLQPGRASADPAEIGAADVVLVAVKTWQMDAAIAAMPPLVGAATVIIPLLNGVEAAGQLSAAFGAGRVAGGLCRISAMVAAPGLIRHVGIEPYIAFGELDNRPSARLEALRQAFARAGVVVEIPADIHAAVWSKFVFIAAMSGVGAAARAPLGVLRSQPETRRLLAQVMEEVAALAAASGVRLPSDLPARTLAQVDGMAPGVTASMARDIIEGRPSELEGQTGAVTRLGRALGVPTPANDLLYAALLPQELRAREEAGF
jgi:2-dehydropantoate 2-reductase